MAAATARALAAASTVESGSSAAWVGVAQAIDGQVVDTQRCQRARRCHTAPRTGQRGMPQKGG